MAVSQVTVVGKSLKWRVALSEPFPDIIVHMDDIRSSGTHAVYRWTLEGHNTGPEGTGNYVKIRGWEYWRYTEDGLIAESFGHLEPRTTKDNLMPSYANSRGQA